MNAVTLIRNALATRQAWFKKFSDPRKDIESECGHPESIDTADYCLAFERGDLAGRIVALYPEECWSDDPVVYETEDENLTTFEKAWDELQKKYQIYSYLQRADILSGIGRFGILLIGVNDGKKLEEPLEGINERGEINPGAEARQLIYLRPFEERLVNILSMQNDLSNPRYGQPLYYSITFEEETPSTAAAASGMATTLLNQRVHWSRVIHLADNRTNSDVYGLPRMKRVFNRLLDLKKVSGGAGEMFWKGGFPGLSIESVPTDGDVELDTDATKEQMEAYMDGLQRYIATVGMSVKSLAIQIADPRPHAEIQIRLIAMAMGVPWRILMGVEVGQLASEQDMRVWNQRLQRRRDKYIDPFILLPFINRLIAIGALPAPDSGIKIHWPDLNTPSLTDRAAIAEKQTSALEKYVRSGVDAVIPPFHFLTLVLGMNENEAKAIIKASSGVSELSPPDPVQTGGTPTPTPRA